MVIDLTWAAILVDLLVLPSGTTCCFHRRTDHPKYDEHRKWTTNQKCLVEYLVCGFVLLNFLFPFSASKFTLYIFHRRDSVYSYLEFDL